MTVPDAGSITIDAADPRGAAATAVLRSYIQDVAERYQHRPVTPAEVDTAVAEHPVDDLVPPDGLLLLAGRDGVVLGCVALLRVAEGLGEVRRLYVSPAVRGRGLGRRLMGEVERRALVGGLTALRLDTRSDLLESRRLYDSLGYREVPPYGGGPYSDRWCAKRLVTVPPQ